MLKDRKLLLLSVRMLIFLFFCLLAIGKNNTQKALILVPSALYFWIFAYDFLRPGRFKLLSKYVDALFLPYLSLTSHNPYSFLAPLSLSIFFSNRNVFVSLILFWSSVGIGLFTGASLIILLPFLAMYIASLSPDLIQSIRKERHYIVELKKAYSELTKQLGRLEKERVLYKKFYDLMDKAFESKDLVEYLTAIKEEFSLRAIHIIPVKSLSSLKKQIDTSRNALVVPVVLEEGYAHVVFYFNSPFELHDLELLNLLEKSAKLINLFVLGFEEGNHEKVRVAV
ncbi:hypothetical protein [Thermocrinis minervae]|uniref:Uncharacterized protein n=1 Tax=Thermocrinis minervae TaxID=381751 RepID=A0A1M6SGW0_9AQUI|nr:hypothetical protein [Thermocrinis minervae]SHK43817.1 hypothetical protein SAMN05444391_1021 [Thermocrinis minervae]